MDAYEHVSLIYGFQHKVIPAILWQAVKAGTLDKHLQKVRVYKGDTYFVPAGMIHRNGAGILVAEVQEALM